MSRVLAVASRELADRRTILAAALVAGLIPFASPLFPGVRADRWAEARDLMALILAAAFGCGTAVVAGTTAVARDLAEGRLSFDFSRPLGAGTIWAGRFLGALALTILVLALVLLPTSLVGGGAFAGSSREGAAWTALLSLGALLLLVPLVHAASIALRSRSGWLGADLVCGVAFVLLVAWASRLLLGAFAHRTLVTAGSILVGLAIPVLWAASAVQVAAGRTDLRRGHRALSLTLWTGLLGLATALASYGIWVVSAGPMDLLDTWGAPAPRGTWVVVDGTARGRGDFAPSILLDSATGTFERIGSRWASTARFSADGRRAVILRPVGWRLSDLEVLVADLGARGASLRETNLAVASLYSAVAVSDDGSRLAVADEQLVTVFEIDSGKTVVSVRLPEPMEKRTAPRFLSFRGRDEVRLCHPSGEPGRLDLYELDVASRRIAKTGTIESDFAFPWLRRWPETDRLFVHDLKAAERAVAVDGRTGARLVVYEAAPAAKAAFRPLHDGRVVAVERDAAGRRLRVFSAEGREDLSIPLERDETSVVGGEPAEGLLFLASVPKREGAVAEPSEYRLDLVDLDAGTVRESGRGLTPLWVPWNTPLDVPPAGETASRLFRTGNAVVLHDPSAGTTRKIAGTGTF